MANNISLSIQNPGTIPANQPDLYLGQDNQLNFLFSNSMGIPSVNPGDVFTINIPDNLISSATADQLLSKNWKVQEVTHQTSSYSYSLTPLKQLDFSGVITISLQKLTGLTATNGDVACNFVIQSGPISGPGDKLFVTAAPNNALKPLPAVIVAKTPSINQEQGEIARGTVYTSPVNNVEGKEILSPPVANQIHLNLKFNGSQLVDKAWDKTPRFIFSFSYGTQSLDLTDALKLSDKYYNSLTSAWNITPQLAIDEANQWQLSPLINMSNTPVWIVEPTENNPHLFTDGSPNLDIVFDHVISALAPGNATVYIQWANIPGYNPGRFALDLTKQKATPKILDFTNKSDSYSSQNLVELDWQTFATDKVLLSWTNNADSKKSGEIVLPAYSAEATPALIYCGSNRANIGNFIPPFMETDVSYACRLIIPGHDDTLKELTLNLDAATSPVISDFDISVTSQPDGIKLTASWLVKTDNVNAYCLLNGVDEQLPLSNGQGAAYSHELLFNASNHVPPSFTLTVKGFEPEVSKTLTYSYKVVQTIKGFQALGVSPDSSTLFLNTMENKVYIVNPFSVPDTPSQSITIGAVGGGLSLFFNPNGKQVFAINNKQQHYIYYFDSDNPPAAVNKRIENEVLISLPELAPRFVAGVNLMYVVGVTLTAPGIYYFDPSNPPQKLDKKISFPDSGAPNDLNLNRLCLNPDGTEAMAYNYSSIGKSPKTLYRFDPENPPQLLSDGIALQGALNEFKYSCDGKTIFANLIGTENIAYSPVTEAPSKTGNLVNVQSPSRLFMSPKSKWVFSLFRVPVYFDGENLPVPATRIVKSSASANRAVLNANKNIAFFADGNDNSINYFDMINPPTETTVVPVGQYPKEIYFTTDGIRVFVNNKGDYSVSVLEICFNKE